jgi:hypothetical protein
MLHVLLVPVCAGVATVTLALLGLRGRKAGLALLTRARSTEGVVSSGGWAMRLVKTVCSRGRRAFGFPINLQRIVRSTLLRTTLLSLSW